MRFIADESCDFAVVRTLRAEGYDVLAVAELSAGLLDSDVLRLAVTEQRLLLTEDKDFGEMVFAGASASSGVIFMRFPGNARQALTQSILALIQNQQKRLFGAFTVLEPGKVRIRKI